MNLSRINKIQGLQGRDYEIEYLRLLTGKDLQDILLTFEDNSGGDSLYEEILLADLQAASVAGTITPGKTYAITDISNAIGYCLVLLKGYNIPIGHLGGNDEVVANGVLIYTSYFSGVKVATWDIQFDLANGLILSYYNRAYDVRCTSETVLQSIFTNLSADLITNCDFSNYTGILTFDSSGLTILKNCDFSNSSADFDTSRLLVAATFSGRILHDFEVPNQAFYPCDFINTIQINADGTNNMEATITLTSSQSNLDFTGFKSAGIVNLVPHFGGNSITTISNNVQSREYKIVSNDTSGLLSIDSGVDITINVVTNSVVVGQILWSGTWVQRNEIYFYRRSTESFILAKSNIYS